MIKKKSKVAITGCRNYSQENVDRAVDRAISELGGISEFIRPGQKVLLKINQLMGKSPEHAVTTHPALVRALIKVVRSAGATPCVGDSPAIAPLEKVAEKSGIKQVCDQERVRLVELDSPVAVKLSSGRLIRSFKVSGKLRDFDAIINVSRLKTHSLTGMTGAVKNLFGCIPGRLKQSYHIRFQDPLIFSEMLLDLGRIIRPVISIMDAVVAMEGNGPAAGSPRKIGILIAGKSAMAVDTVAASVVGMKQKEVATILAAKNQGSPDADMRNISVIGEKYPKIRDFKRPRSIMNRIPLFIQKAARSWLTARPVVNLELCIGCGHCMKICPAKAIKITKHKAVFYHSRCILCYCCHEVCPQKAIRLKKGMLAKALENLLGMR